MKTSAKGRKFIESFEGLILKAYDDHNDHVVEVGQHAIGVLTIGYGHTDAAGPPKVYVGQQITQSDADNILASDLASVELEVNHLVKVPLNQDQYDALVSFQFNTGALGRSTLLKELNAGNYTAAANDFLAWNHAGGAVMAGLTRRREAEKAMFLSPAKPVSHVTTAVVTGTAAGAVVVANHQSYEGLIIAGIVFAVAITIGVIMHFYNLARSAGVEATSGGEKGKTNAVVSVQPVVVSQVDLGKV